MTTYPEPMVARVIGIPKTRIAKLRKETLTRPGDWDLIKHVVHYQKEGLEKLLEGLGLDAEVFGWAEPGEAKAKAAPKAEPAEATPAAPNEAPAPEKNFTGADAVAKQVEAADRPMIELTVAKLSRNPLVLHATTPGGAEVLVKVKVNRNFRAGMKLKAKEPKRPGVWFHVGNCPRRPGHY